MNSCDDTIPWDYQEAMASVEKMFLICAPFTIFFNAAVIAIAFLYVNLDERLDQWFVVNMSAANLVFGLVNGVQPYAHLLPIWFCYPFYVVAWSCTAASVLFLLLLNIHKFITLFTPYHAQRLVSKRKVSYQILVSWILVTTYSIVSAAHITFTDPCYPCKVKSQVHLYVGMIMIFYACPLLLSLVISICIFALAQSKTRNPTGARMAEDKKTLKRIIFVFSYTVFTAVTFLPFRIGYSIFLICSLSHSSLDVCLSPGFYKAVLSLLYLLPFGSVINPLITIVTQKSYRRGVRNLLQNIFVCINCSTEQRSTLSRENCKPAYV